MVTIRSAPWPGRRRRRATSSRVARDRQQPSHSAPAASAMRRQREAVRGDDLVGRGASRRACTSSSPVARIATDRAARDPDRGRGSSRRAARGRRAEPARRAAARSPARKSLPGAGGCWRPASAVGAERRSCRRRASRPPGSPRGRRLRARGAPVKMRTASPRAEPRRQRHGPRRPRRSRSAASPGDGRGRAIGVAVHRRARRTGGWVAARHRRFRQHPAGGAPRAARLSDGSGASSARARERLGDGAILATENHSVWPRSARTCRHLSARARIRRSAIALSTAFSMS